MILVRRSEDWASPAEEQEVHDDGGAPAAGGGDRGGSARGRCDPGLHRRLRWQQPRRDARGGGQRGGSNQ
jgi:hypothetical protein